MMTATAAVEAMENNSPTGANAVAQFMATTSLPDGNWLGLRAKANRKLQLAGNLQPRECCVLPRAGTD